MENKNRIGRRLIIVSYRLPYDVIKNELGFRYIQNSGGLISAILTMVEQSSQLLAQDIAEIHWVGHCKNELKEIHKIAFNDKKISIHPVFINDTIHQKFYEGFCNNCIWPLFHYLPAYASFDETNFSVYREVNIRFLEELKLISKPDDIVWVHDSQLRV